MTYPILECIAIGHSHWLNCNKNGKWVPKNSLKPQNESGVTKPEDEIGHKKFLLGKITYKEMIGILATYRCNTMKCQLQSMSGIYLVRYTLLGTHRYSPK